MLPDLYFGFPMFDSGLSFFFQLRNSFSLSAPGFRQLHPFGQTSFQFLAFGSLSQ
jgi:hypothetical protein